MKKLLLIAAGLMLSCVARTQLIIYDAAAGRFSFPQPPNNHRLADRFSTPPVSSADPGVFFVFEYGDGYFTTDLQHTYRYKQDGSYPTVLTLSARYDTVKAPKVLASRVADMLSATPYVYQPLLAPGEDVRVTPLATDLNPGEEMLFIITYRQPAKASNARLHFFYNNNGFNGVVKASGDSMIQQPVVLGDDIYRIRTYFGEALDGAATANTTTVTGIANTQYADILTWELPYSKESEERNIFVTLHVKDTLTLETTGIFQAALVYTPFDVTETVTLLDTLIMTTSARPHDPNYITAVPGCLVKGSGTKPVHYHLQFQNEGAGTAHKLDIAISFDRRLMAALEKLSNKSFTIVTGKKKIGAFSYTFDKKNAKLLFGIELTGTVSVQVEGQPRTKAVIDSSLSSNRVPYWFINPLTMGTIDFDLDIPLHEEADFYAVASITFYDKDTASMAPVNTDTSFLFVREKCNDYLLPVTERLSRPNPAGPRVPPVPCTDCCRTILSLCWWWWVIIAAGILIILGLVLALRSKKKEDEEEVKNE